MSTNPYQAPQVDAAGPFADRPGRSQAAVFHWPFAAACVMWAIIAIGIELQDKRWGALAIAYVCGPIGNGAILALAFVYAVVRKLAARHMAVGIPMLFVAGAAIGSSAVIFGAIFLMDLHGC
ncbi:MAG TPA: hypothetical protein VJ783_26540 [Pirellulales bacterium]|nr:hypothetical protein [Pirellulales bacterium]